MHVAKDLSPRGLARTALQTTARLECRIERTYGGPRSPCRCGKPLVFFDDEKDRPMQPDRTCPACRRECTLIHVRIVQMPTPEHSRHLAALNATEAATGSFTL